MKQKFRRNSFVKVCKDMPKHMKHFECDFIGIVNGTYSQLYGGNDINSYSLYQILNNKIVNRISWYYEEQLTLMSDQNYEKAEEMIEEYNFK